LILMNIDDIDEDWWYSWIYWWYLWCTSIGFSIDDIDVANTKLPVKSQHQHVDHHASHAASQWLPEQAVSRSWVRSPNSGWFWGTMRAVLLRSQLLHLRYITCRAIRESKHATPQIPICSDEGTTLFVWKHQQQSLYFNLIDKTDKEVEGMLPIPTAHRFWSHLPSICSRPWVAQHLAQHISSSSQATYFWAYWKFCQSGGYPTCYWRFLRPGMARLLHQTGPSDAQCQMCQVLQQRPESSRSQAPRHGALSSTLRCSKGTQGT
jgi:hypothetical protein